MQLQQYSLGAGQKGSHQAPITGHNHRLLVSLNKTLVHFFQRCIHHAFPTREIHRCGKSQVEWCGSTWDLRSLVAMRDKTRRTVADGGVYASVDGSVAVDLVSLDAVDLAQVAQEVDVVVHVARDGRRGRRLGCGQVRRRRTGQRVALQSAGERRLRSHAAGYRTRRSGANTLRRLGRLASPAHVTCPVIKTRTIYPSKLRLRKETLNCDCNLFYHRFGLRTI